MLKAGCLAVVFGALIAAPAQAQMTWTDKAFLNVNVGAQTGSHTLDTTGTFDLYGEQGSLSTTQDVKGGGLFDISGGYKVWRNLAVGIGYSHTGSDTDVAIAANVPDPIFFDRLRPLTAVSSGAKHSENVIHFQGTWIVPVTDKADVGFSFGPSIFNVKQDLPTAITVNEPGPTLASTTIVSEKKTAVGFNLGMDVNYFFTKKVRFYTKQIGAGLLLRYARASVDFDGANDSLSVGGFQIAVGLRVRF
jgi:hypothetical protein